MFFKNIDMKGNQIKNVVIGHVTELPDPKKHIGSVIFLSDNVLDENTVIENNENNDKK